MKLFCFYWIISEKRTEARLLSRKLFLLMKITGRAGAGAQVVDIMIAFRLLKPADKDASIKRKVQIS